jgi:hypothetical protein
VLELGSNVNGLRKWNEMVLTEITKDDIGGLSDLTGSAQSGRAIGQDAEKRKHEWTPQRIYWKESVRLILIDLKSGKHIRQQEKQIKICYFQHFLNNCEKPLGVIFILGDNHLRGQFIYASYEFAIVANGAIEVKAWIEAHEKTFAGRTSKNS